MASDKGDKVAPTVGKAGLVFPQTMPAVNSARILLFS